MRSLMKACVAVALLAPCAARAQAPAIANVLSAVTLPFNNDGAMDRAVLVNNEDGADLYLFLADDSTPSTPKLALVKKNFVWSGGMWGSLPSLSTNGKGSLIVKSENMAVGRNKWEQSLTVARRNGVFVVIGVSYTAYDTLDPKAGGTCDINLATGKGARNGKPVTMTPAMIKVADWSEDNMPKACQF
jgi:hypothetical protein